MCCRWLAQRCRNKGKQHRKSGTAFSLVEVCLALGVISSILIPLLGLTMVGLQTFRDSQLEVRCATVAQRLIAAAQVVPQGKLERWELSFDSEGVPVENEREAVLKATLVPHSGEVLDLPEASGVMRVSVTITGSALANQKRIYSSLIANTGIPDESAVE